jgi:F-type H+-transporting ATPase subunit delta
VAANPELLQFADNPKATAEQVLDVVADVAFGAPLPPMRPELPACAPRQRPLAALPEIAKQFRALANAQSGSSDAVVYSAFPIDAAAAGQRVAALEKRFGRKLRSPCSRTRP